MSTRLVLSIAMVVTAVGALDSLIGGEWDLLAVFVLLAALLLTLWLQHRANRRPVSIRPDLAVWLERRSDRTGEPFDDLLDRAVAGYRQRLYAGAADGG